MLPFQKTMRYPGGRDSAFWIGLARSLTVIDPDGAETRANVADEEDGVEYEEGDEEQVERRLHLGRAVVGLFISLFLIDMG